MSTPTKETEKVENGIVTYVGGDKPFTHFRGEISNLEVDITWWLAKNNWDDTGIPEIVADIYVKDGLGIAYRVCRYKSDEPFSYEIAVKDALETPLRSPRPYEPGQACDGSIGTSVMALYYAACQNLGLDANECVAKAYPDECRVMEWDAIREEAEWQGGIAVPAVWDESAISGVTQSLHNINYHTLASEFADAIEARESASM